MPWVNKSGYSPGSRHYVETVTRSWGNEEDRHGYIYKYFKDIASGLLCKSFKDPWIDSGYQTLNKSTGKKGYTLGGLSSKEKVNLLQRNLCGRCVKIYVEARPELKEALNAAKVGIES